MIHDLIGPIKLVKSTSKNIFIKKLERCSFKKKKNLVNQVIHMLTQ
jgi:hypothetical protein